MKHVCNMWTFSYILSEENCSFSILEYKQKIWWFAQGRHQVSAHKSWISPLKSQYICLFNVEQPVSGLLLPPLLQCRDLKQRQMPPKRQVTVIQKALPSRWKSRWGHWKRQWSKPWKKKAKKTRKSKKNKKSKGSHKETRNRGPCNQRSRTVSPERTRSPSPSRTRSPSRFGRAETFWDYSCEFNLMFNKGCCFCQWLQVSNRGAWCGCDRAKPVAATGCPVFLGSQYVSKSFHSDSTNVHTYLYHYIYIYLYIYIYISIKFVFNLVMIDAMARFWWICKCRDGDTWRKWSGSVMTVFLLWFWHMDSVAHLNVELFFVFDIRWCWVGKLSYFHQLWCSFLKHLHPVSRFNVQ